MFFRLFTLELIKNVHITINILNAALRSGHDALLNKPINSIFC